MEIPSSAGLIDRLVSLQKQDKKLGQHYLVNDDFIDEAISFADLSENDVVLEIGPGPGSLTAKLLETKAKVVAIELDEIACEHLRFNFSVPISNGQLTLIEGDVLQQKLPAELTSVVANIPYQISSPLIEQLVKHHRSGRGLNSITLLLQDEFATRLCMSEGPASRGPLGINSAFEWNIVRGSKVPPHAFSPAPKIHSRIVHLSPLLEAIKLEKSAPTANLKLARQIVSTCFLERRKMMRNRLQTTPKRISRVKGWYGKNYRAAAKKLLSQGETIGLPTGWQEARPEKLNVEMWLTIAAWMEKFRDN